MSTTAQIVIEARGLDFPALSAGDGPLVLMLHGFPDGPETFRPLLPGLAETGLRAVAPTLRGYAPSGLSQDGDYHVDALAADVLAWADALGRSRFHLVGHDWGATIGYAVASLAPERLASLTVISVPHPARMAEVSATSPEQQARYQYIIDFQSPDAERMVAADHLAYLVDLWRRWSPHWAVPEDVLEAMRARFGSPEVLTAALSYYRQALDFGSDAATRSQRLLSGPFRAPTLGVYGADDGCILASTFEAAMQPRDFEAGLDLRRIDGAGHFPHQERPAQVLKELTAWLHRHTAA